MQISVFVKGSEDKFPRLTADLSTIHLRPEEYVDGRLTPVFHGGATICAFSPENYPYAAPVMEQSRCSGEEYEVTKTYKDKKTGKIELITYTKRDGYNRRLGRLMCIERFLNRMWCLETLLGQTAKLYDHVRIIEVGPAKPKSITDMLSPGDMRIVVEPTASKYIELDAYYRLTELTTQARGETAVWPRPPKAKIVWAPRPVNGSAELRWQPTAVQ